MDKALSTTNVLLCVIAFILFKKFFPEELSNIMNMAIAGGAIFAVLWLVWMIVRYFGRRALRARLAPLIEQRERLWKEGEYEWAEKFPDLAPMTSMRCVVRQRSGRRSVRRSPESMLNRHLACRLRKQGLWTLRPHLLFIYALIHYGKTPTTRAASQSICSSRRVAVPAQSHFQPGCPCARGVRRFVANAIAPADVTSRK